MKCKLKMLGSQSWYRKCCSQAESFLCHRLPEQLCSNPTWSVPLVILGVCTHTHAHPCTHPCTHMLGIGGHPVSAL